MRVFKVIIIISLFSIILLFLFGLWQIFFTNKPEKKSQTNFLSSQSNNAGGLSIEVKPLDISSDKPSQFKIFFNTHQGNLDFNLLEQTLLEDDKGNVYPPLDWQGAMGGHHISGLLIFPPIEKTQKIKLIFYNLYGIEKRIFEWDLYENE